MTKSEAMPVGTAVVIDGDTRELAGDRLLGGSPRRVLSLSGSGRAAWAGLRAGVVDSRAAGVLARRLTDAGMAHPRPAAVSPAVTVVVPVRDRVGQLDRCLASIGARHPVVVVDDGSADPAGLAAVVRRHAARLVRRDEPGGPAAARNDGVRDIGTELIAFVDSDCLVPPGWLEALSGHFTDPAVAAVAPRVVSARRDGSSRYRDRCGLLDAGPKEARVQPLGLVPYVATATLVVRRSALIEVGSFDTGLRYGEDVDLVWRLHAAGWRVRYDPSVEVRHDEPIDWPARIAKRFRYGTASAPLAARHPGASGHLVAGPWPLAFVAAVVARKPRLAALAVAGTYATTAQALRTARVAELSPARLTAEALTRTWQGFGRYATQFALPVLAAAALPRRNRVRRVAMLAALATAAPVAESRRRRDVPRLRLVAGRLVDDVAYGAGVYAGCITHRNASPLKVVVRRRGSEH